MALWFADRPLVLASQSRARQSLLAAAGIPYEVRPADIDERATEAGLAERDPAAVAKGLAAAKARHIAATHPGRLVLGADQTLGLGAQRFSKPRDLEAARAQLLSLRGRTHTLHSGLALVRDGDVLFAHVEAAHLTMRDFSDSFLDAYLQMAGNAATTSVGAYQLEGLGIHLFATAEGDHSTVLGLPLLSLLEALRRIGVLAR